MKRRIKYTAFLASVILQITSCFLQPSQVCAQEQVASLPEAKLLSDHLTAARERFIENSGQYPRSIRFIAPHADGCLVFFDDRVEFRKTIRHTSDVDDRYDQEGTTPFMSRKVQRIANDAVSARHSVHTDTVLLFDTAHSLEGRGLRTERIHYFGSAAIGERVTNIPTWDTLMYSGDTGNISVSFDSGDVLFEHIDGLNDQLYRFVWRSASHSRISDDSTPKAQENSPAPPSNMVYSTLLGGSDTDGITTVIQISEDRVVLIGTTSSSDFPTSEKAYSDSLQGDPSSIYSRDVFITCLDIIRNEIVFSTFFGGWDLESLKAAEIDRDGNIVFAGNTWSDDLPVTPNAWQPRHRGNGDGYIAALDSTGSELIFCSYIGGSGIENLWDMHIDAAGNIVITGLTDSWNYPTTPGVVQSRYGGGE
ncbi:MAG: hypothetical protein JXA28_11530, partial [Bacteroidetes bacterium]|nr:hypothetical protein [Bacteroidota bacterium]